MGARNVSAVFAMYPDLPPLPKLLLVWMALKSLDSMGKDGRPPRVYFDGEQSLIDASGRSRRQVYEGLRTLRECQAITVLQAGRLKYRAVYKLALDPLEKASDPDPSVRKTAPKSVRKTAPNRVRKTAIEGAENRTPKKYVGGTEESRGGEISSQAFVSPAPVDNSDAEQIDLGTAQQIVAKALDIEAAATRIRELAADGADYTAAYIELAHQIQDGATP